MSILKIYLNVIPCIIQMMQHLQVVNFQGQILNRIALTREVSQLRHSSEAIGHRCNFVFVEFQRL
jgi:hypothetical protein